MSSSNQHPKEAIRDLLDERIDPRTHEELRAHLEECEECRRELESLRWLRQSVLRPLSENEPPESLRTRIQAVLDAEEGLANNRTVSSFPPWRRFAYWLSAVAAVVLIAVYLYFGQSSGLPGQVSRDFRHFKGEALELQMLTTENQTLEEFFAHRGIRFETRVFDLGMMNFQLMGGRTHQIDGEPSALFVYRGPDGVYLLCQMFEGSIGNLPAGAEVREHNCIRFHIYRRGAITLAFWQEGSVLCVLASDTAPEDVIQLAFAKAVKM